MLLFEKDSHLDLVCRGFDREYIKRMTGVDVGYHGCNVKSQLKGVNRGQYKIEYVRKTYSGDDIRSAISDYGKGLSKACVLNHLGIAGENIIKLKDLFKALGFESEFTESDRQVRKGNMRQGCVRKYGTDNVFNLSAFQQKAKESRVRIYGGEYTLSKDSSLASKAQNTFINRMSDESFRQSVIDKRKATCLSHYGVEAPAQSDIVKHRMRKTCKNKYGFSHFAKTEFFRDMMRHRDSDAIIVAAKKSQQTCMERYGVANYSQTDEARDAQSKRMLNSDYQKQINATKRRNESFNISGPEDRLHEMLINRFGVSDIEQNYICDKYPFACDFYVKSLDLFIELNAHWIHNNHFFDENDEIDVQTRNLWESKNSQYYKNAVETWCIRDVNKREVARQNKLNYLVFWDTQLDDVSLWLAMGCPIAHDYEREYSWLPLDRQLCYVSSENSISHIARKYNWQEFYKNELWVWEQNVNTKKGKVKAVLYANRYKYLGKLPNELSDNEILRGLSISGLVRGYTTFHTREMEYILDKYKVNEVYDPCAGWGERMLCCAKHNVKYTGCEINSVQVDNLKRMIAGETLTDANVIEMDAADNDMHNGTHDMVFTCPPYGNREIYSNIGAENLQYDAFLSWWRNVVAMSVCKDTEYFVFQIDDKHSNDMSDIVYSFGFVLCDTIVVGEKNCNHFLRRRGVKQKRNCERIYVFQRG